MSSVKSIIEIENLLSKYSQYYDVEQKTPLSAFWEVLERYIIPFRRLQEHIPEITQHGIIEEVILREFGRSPHNHSVDLLTVEAIAYKFESSHIPSATVNNLHRLVDSFMPKEDNDEKKRDELDTIYWCTNSIINFINHITDIVQNIKQSGVHLDKGTISSSLLNIHHAMLWIQKTNSMALAVQVLNKCVGTTLIDEAQASLIEQNIVKVIKSALITSMVQHITLDVSATSLSIPTPRSLIDVYITKKNKDIDKIYSTYVDRDRFAINQLIQRIKNINISYLSAYSETTEQKLQHIHIKLLKYAPIANIIYSYINDIFSHQMSSIQVSLFVKAVWKQTESKRELSNVVEDIKQLLNELKELDNRLFATFIGKHAFMDYIESLSYQSDASSNKLIASVRPIDISANEIIEVFLALVELLSDSLNNLLIDCKSDRKILVNWRAVVEENSKFVESTEVVCKGLSNIHQIVWEECSATII